MMPCALLTAISKGNHGLAAPTLAWVECDYGCLPYTNKLSNLVNDCSLFIWISQHLCFRMNMVRQQQLNALSNQQKICRAMCVPLYIIRVGAQKRNLRTWLETWTLCECLSYIHKSSNLTMRKNLHEMHPPTLRHTNQ